MRSGTARKPNTKDVEWRYERRRPKQTLLYQLVAEHYPRLIALLAVQGRSLPHYVQREFDGFLKCDRLERGFLRVRCQDCHSERLVASAQLRRPAVATDRLALTPQGNVRYTLKTPYRDGTTHIILEPLDFIARLAALVPKPRVNLTRFHRLFAPHHRLRQQLTPSRRGKQNAEESKTPAQRRDMGSTTQTGVQIDIETCDQCGGSVKVIACTEDPALVKRILNHLEQRSEAGQRMTHPARALSTVISI